MFQSGTSPTSTSLLPLWTFWHMWNGQFSPQMEKNHLKEQFIQKLIHSPLNVIEKTKHRTELTMTGHLLSLQECIGIYLKQYCKGKSRSQASKYCIFVPTMHSFGDSTLYYAALTFRGNLIDILKRCIDRSVTSVTARLKLNSSCKRHQAYCECGWLFVTLVFSPFQGKTSPQLTPATTLPHQWSSRFVWAARCKHFPENAAVFL